MDSDAVAKLTSDQLEALALVHELRTDKMIAQALARRHPDRPITHFAVKERLRRARQVLGVSDRLAAANLVFGAPNVRADRTYPQRVCPPTDLFEPSPLMSFLEQDEVPSARQSEVRDSGDHDFGPLPPRPPWRWWDHLLRKRGERFNDLTAGQTTAAIAATMLMLCVAAALILLGRLTWH